MIFVFDQFELDPGCAELRRDKMPVALEPRAFSLLCLLVENHDRLVCKEEIIEKAWDGRIVSDSAISTGIKTLRKALGDDGTTQEYVRTVRGRGFRFVARVKISPNVVTVLAVPGAEPEQVLSPAETVSTRRPSIAILPFSLVGHTEKFGAIADALPAELIASLSRLRWLWVVARGSTFRFRAREPDIDSVRSSLGANYCVAGVVEIFGNKTTISVELIDTQTHMVVWSERYPSKVENIHETRTNIIRNVIAALELHIPLHEANKARVKSPEHLDAWSEYHIGLQHMYRFNMKDNQVAADHLKRATELDSEFARAYAARSFTSFQNAFLKYSADTATSIADARRFAEKSVAIDPLDPFGNFNLARTCWLEGDPDNGVELLDRAVQLSPNFAQGFYARGWTDVMAGRGAAARENVTTAIALSPLDPFMYAMRATLGLSHLLEGDYESAAAWAEKGARAPGAHHLIGAIAVAAHQLNGNSAMADYWTKSVRARRDDVVLQDFFTAFPFRDEEIRKTISQALTKSGI